MHGLHAAHLLVSPGDNRNRILPLPSPFDETGLVLGRRDRNTSNNQFQWAQEQAQQEAKQEQELAARMSSHTNRDTASYPLNYHSQQDVPHNGEVRQGWTYSSDHQKWWRAETDIYGQYVYHWKDFVQKRP